MNAGSSINLTQGVDLLGDLRITDASSVTFGDDVTIGGNLVISGVDQVNFRGDLDVQGTITIETEVGDLIFRGDVTSFGDVSLTVPDDESITFNRRLAIDNGSADLTVHQVDDLTFDDNVLVRDLTQVSGRGTTTFEREIDVRNADITTGEQIRFRDTLTSSDNVTLFAEQIDLNDAVEVADDFSVIIPNNIVATEYTIDFDDTLEVGGNLVLSDLDRVTVDGAAVIDGTVDIFTGGDDITFNSSLKVGDDVRLETVDSADITIDGNLSVGAGNSDFTIVNTRNATFTGSVTVRDLTITDGSGTATFTQQIDADDIAITIHTGVLITNTVTISGSMTIHSEEIDFGGNTGSLNGVGVSSVLTLAPYSPTSLTSIDLGSPVTNSGVLDISDSDFRAIATNWDLVVLGHLNTGMGTVRIGTLLLTQTTSVTNTLEVHGGTVIVEEAIELSTSGVDYLLLKANDASGDGVIIDGVIGSTSSVRNDWVRIESQADVEVNAPVYASERISIATGFDADGVLANDSGDILIDGSSSNTGLLATSDALANGVIELISGAVSGDLIFRETAVTAAGANSALKLYAPNGSIDGTTDESLLTANSLSVQVGGSIALNTAVSEILQTSVSARSDISAIDGNVFFGPQVNHWAACNQRSPAPLI